MNRAVVVLILLIANAVVSSRNNRAPHPAPPPSPDYSLGVFSNLDGAAPRPLGSYCNAARVPEADPLFDVRL
ncbi:MAG: hypothetical protein M3032_12340 [Verrucomicrobiota bacterium]|nr:hypothetical protein [Verrucomicrobiota bacterium]